jgi:hypothetical protein
MIETQEYCFSKSNNSFMGKLNMKYEIVFCILNGDETTLSTALRNKTVYLYFEHGGTGILLI